jgi:hypothetical protein
MYLAEIDEANAILLSCYSGMKAPEDFEQFVASFKLVESAAHKSGKALIFVVQPDPNYSSPNSHDRQRFAELRDQCLLPNLFILVTRSGLLRGAMMAVSCLSPITERQRSVACESFAEALIQTGRYREDAVLPLRRMYATLQARVVRRRAI